MGCGGMWKRERWSRRDNIVMTPHPVRACTCGTPISLPHARYCDPCRSHKQRKKLKWVSTETIDAFLRQAYTRRLDRRSSEIPGLNAYAAQCGWPHWALKKRATALGLTRTKEQPWSSAELGILKQFAWMCDARIKTRLSKAGYHRTETAIHLKLKRERYKADLPFYSAHSVAACMRIDDHVVTRWIRLGYLKARRRETARTEAQGGDIWLVLERDLRAFLLKYPTQWDIRKVDQLWFLDVLTEGKVAA